MVDLAAVRRRGDPREKDELARRIYTLWRPIFSHLDARDHGYHLQKHVEDETAVQIRALFGLDADGRDRALMIVRVHEHEIDGRVWARLTVNAGFDPAYVQSRFGQEFLALEAWRYRLAHPFRPFFIVDSAVSAASYCAYAKTFFGFAPRPGRPIPASWWALAEAGAEALGGESVDGAPREVRRFPAVVRDPNPRRTGSVRSAEAARFFQQATAGIPNAGILILAPLSFRHYGLTTLRYAWVRLVRFRG